MATRPYIATEGPSCDANIIKNALRFSRGELHTYELQGRRANPTETRVLKKQVFCLIEGILSQQAAHAQIRSGDGLQIYPIHQSAFSYGMQDSGLLMDLPDQTSSEAQGDFVALFARHSDSLKAFVRMLIRDPHDCDDVWQSVSLVLWKKFETYDVERPFDRWARGIIIREVLSHRKSISTRPTPLSSEALEQVLVVFEDHEYSSHAYSDAQEALDKCIKQLPARYREVVSLRYFRQRSFDLIANDLKSTSVAIRKTLSRARQKLADCIRRRLESVSAE